MFDACHLICACIADRMSSLPGAGLLGLVNPIFFTWKILEVMVSAVTKEKYKSNDFYSPTTT